MNTVTKENYKTFTYTNEELLTDKPVTIVHEFHGLNGGLRLVNEHYPLLTSLQSIISSILCPVTVPGAG